MNAIKRNSGGLEPCCVVCLPLCAPPRHNESTTPSHYNHRPFAETLMRFGEFLLSFSPSAFQIFDKRRKHSGVSDFTRMIGALWTAVLPSQPSTLLPRKNSPASHNGLTGHAHDDPVVLDCEHKVNSRRRSPCNFYFLHSPPKPVLSFRLLLHFEALVLGARLLLCPVYCFI